MYPNEPHHIDEPEHAADFWLNIVLWFRDNKL